MCGEVTKTPILTSAEQRLLRAAAKGDLADFRATDPADNQPLQGSSWSDQRTLSAEVVRALATGGDPRWNVHSAGLRIAGARIAGALDLAHVEIHFPLAFIGCSFERELSLRNASVNAVFLGGSALPGFDARSLRADSDVQLCDGFRTNGTVRLDHATIAGNLSFNGADLHSDGCALTADSATIGRHLLMSNGFKAAGEVSTRYARIGGLFYCSHGRFDNPQGVALNADGVTVNGDMVMSNGFLATGEVSMRGARLRQLLYCAHGTFRNPGADALLADDAEIDGRAFLGEWFSAKGCVRLPGARLAGDLYCVGGIFQNAGGDAILADGISVAGNVRMHTRFLAQGAVRLANSTIGATLNCSAGRFENSGGVALSADGATISGDVILTNGFRADGSVLLSGAKIGGALESEGGDCDRIILDDAVIDQR